MATNAPTADSLERVQKLLHLRRSGTPQLLRRLGPLFKELKNRVNGQARKLLGERLRKSELNAGLSVDTVALDDAECIGKHVHVRRHGIPAEKVYLSHHCTIKSITPEVQGHVYSHSHVSRTVA